MTVVSLDMAYRSFGRFWQASTPASIRRLSHTVVTQIPLSTPSTAGSNAMISERSHLLESSLIYTYKRSLAAPGGVEVESYTRASTLPNNSC